MVVVLGVSGGGGGRRAWTWRCDGVPGSNNRTS